MKGKLDGYSLFKFIVLLLFLAAAIYFVAYFQKQGIFGAAAIGSFIESKGALASIVFIAVYSLLTVILVPAFLLNFVAAVIFGIWHGTLYCWIGAVIAATVSFWIARLLGRNFVEKLVSKRVKRVDALFKKLRFDGVFMIRNIILLPFAEVNYFFGITGVRFKDYFWGSFFGIILPTFILVYLFAELGQSISSGVIGLFSLRLLLPLVVYTVFALAPFIYRRLAK